MEYVTLFHQLLPGQRVNSSLFPLAWLSFCCCNMLGNLVCLTVSNFFLNEGYNKYSTNLTSLQEVFHRKSITFNLGVIQTSIVGINNTMKSVYKISS